MWNYLTTNSDSSKKIVIFAMSIKIHSIESWSIIDIIAKVGISHGVFKEEWA
jgi:hypothetical protein